MDCDKSQLSQLLYYAIYILATHIVEWTYFMEWRYVFIFYFF